jgi:hypothetical protein
VHLVFDIFQGIGLAAAVGVRPFVPALAAGALAAGDVELTFKHTSYAFLQKAPFLLVLVIAVILVTLVERQLQAREGEADAGRTRGGAGRGARVRMRGGEGKAGGAGKPDSGKPDSGKAPALRNRGSGKGAALRNRGGGIAAAALELGPLTVILVLAGAVLGALFFAGELSRGHAVVWPGYVGGPICALIAAAASQPLFARVRARLDAAAAQALPVYAEGAAILLAVLSVLLPPVGPVGLALLLWLVVAERRRGERKYAGLRILR